MVHFRFFFTPGRANPKNVDWQMYHPRACAKPHLRCFTVYGDSFDGNRNINIIESQISSLIFI